MSKHLRKQAYPAPILIVYTVDPCTGSGLIREDEGVLQPAVEAVSDLIADAQPLLLASRETPDMMLT
jgi:hypothetical protein